MSLFKTNHGEFGEMKAFKKILVLGGGTGTNIVLRGLRENENFALTAGVAVTDTGGSTARLRKELDIPAVGDLRHAIEAFIVDDFWKNVFRYRFQGKEKPPIREIVGHVVGNIILASLQKIEDDNFIHSLTELHRKLGIPERFRVLPITLDNINLVAEYPNGEKLEGEENIGDKNKNPLPVKNVTINPSYARVTRECEEAIEGADAIIFPPGSLITSIIAALLPVGVKEALRLTKAKKIAFVNIMTQPGETSGTDIHGKELIYRASDFLAMMESYAGVKMDYVICNDSRPSEYLVKRYESVGSHFVECDLENNPQATPSQTVIKTDLVYEDERTMHIRHHFIKIEWLISELLK